MGVPFSSNQLSMIYALALAGKFQDNCNCDGYATSIFTLSVSSASENGFHNCSHPHHHLTHNHHKHPDYHYLRKNQVASLGTANNAAVLWPQLIAQAVAGVPQKYFLWNLKQFENWENFRRHQVGNPLVYFLGTFFFRESTFAIEGNSDNWIYTIDPIVAILKWLPFYHNTPWISLSALLLLGFLAVIFKHKNTFLLANMKLIFWYYN